MSSKMISIVCIIPEQLGRFKDWLLDIQTTVGQHFEHCELILINNGASKGEPTALMESIKDLHRFRILSLSQEYNIEVAIKAGVEHSIGDYVVVMTPGEHPPQAIPQMVKMIDAGAQYVIGQQNQQSKASYGYKMLAKLFFFASSKILSFPIHHSWTNFICLSREVSNLVTKDKKHVRFLRLLGTEAGLKYATIPFDPLDENRKAKKVTAKRIVEGFRIIAANTDRLLQFCSILSLGVAVVDALYIVYSLALYLFLPNIQSGWTSTSMFLAVMFGIMFLVLGVISQYIGLIYREVVSSPLYHISCEYGNSDCNAFDDLEGINVE